MMNTIPGPVMVKESVPPPPHNTPLTGKVQPKAGKIGPTSKATPRRRSFDNTIHPGARSKTAKAPAKSQSSTIFKFAGSETTEPETDSWDSVSEQPFCNICQMAFKSIGFRDRHLKYSDYHAKNVALKKEAAAKKAGKAPPPPPPAAVAVPVIEKPAVPEPQVEGVHYKLLYTGSKVFWRTQQTIDVDMYLHIIPNVLEVICFDSAKHKEVARIYLNYSIIENTLQNLVSADFDAVLKERTHLDRFFQFEDEEAFRQTLLMQRLTTYVLQRLQIGTTGGTGSTGSADSETTTSTAAAAGSSGATDAAATADGSMAVTFVELYGDDEVGSPLLAAPPAELVPRSIIRRRKSSTEEVEAAINNLQLEQQQIARQLEIANGLTTSAERIAAAVHAAVVHMSEPKWYDQLCEPRRRLVRAVRRVVRQRLVARTRAMLKAKEDKAKEKEAPKTVFSFFTHKG